ncbi:hypothetical protein [Flavobacterium sp.]|uniref:hypothetical protein n=1 Tax=Flavobacterium sp. TaxID=239 RepID=UPI00120B0305|nr:hypothetical protein [Flavobacterium sp.]RZJ69197.1 MAG: hypothetical protein EOO49_18325 [Flavobacterium sp.]
MLKIITKLSMLLMGALAQITGQAPRSDLTKAETTTVKVVRMKKSTNVISAKTTTFTRPTQTLIVTS